MKEYTGFEYLKIDVANNYNTGLDKLTFEERIQWTTDNMEQLEVLAEDQDWKNKPLYLKAVQAIRKAQGGEPTGHMVALDATCSGMSLLSVLSGCEAGARATGLIDPNKRADAYTECTELMAQILGKHIPGEREKVKMALMTAFYGSRAEPKKEFGDDTPELNAFYRAMYMLSPGSCKLLNALLNSWNPWTLAHEWKLPDGYDAKVKVMQKIEKRIEVDELDHASFTYLYYENIGERFGVKNPANCTHSTDAYVLRSLLRRCNYNLEDVRNAEYLIQIELISRILQQANYDPRPLLTDTPEEELLYYIAQYRRSSVADIIILPYLTEENICSLDTEHLKKLNSIIETMLVHKPFPVITVHDAFAAHPNNLNHVRKHYKNILAELADSRLADDLLSQLYKTPVVFPKESTSLGSKIRKSAYALC
jgi:hypothetical protein